MSFLLSNTSNFRLLLALSTRCNSPGAVQSARGALRSSVSPARGSKRGSVLLALACGGQQSPAEKRPNQHAADDVNRQRPPGLRITSGADPMSGGEGINAQRQHMEAPPPSVANARAQPGTDADGDAQVQCHNP